MNGAPDWQDGECCFRCRTQFTLVARKHHCRNCGNIFCAKCSSQQITIARLNIDKAVRVCDGCYEKISSKNSDPLKMALNSEVKEQPPKKKSSSSVKSLLTSSNEPSSSASAPSEQELKEEEELQLALALSLSETPTKVSFPDCRQFEEPIVPKNVENTAPTTIVTSNSLPTVTNSTNQTSTNVVEQQNNYSSAPEKSIPQQQQQQPKQPQVQVQAQPSFEYNLQGRDLKVFNCVAEVQATLEIFNNRLNACKLRNRSITNDSAIQSLFLKLNTEFQPKLTGYIKTYEDERAGYERLQDKLSQIADARAALDDLREEHQEKMRQLAADAERQRQNQLASKLEAMRQKKSQMMQYQRELALQRIREQEMMLQQPQQQQSSQGYQPPPATTQHQQPQLPDYQPPPITTQQHQQQPLPEYRPAAILTQQHQQQSLPDYQSSSITSQHQQVPLPGYQPPSIMTLHQQVPSSGYQPAPVVNQHQQGPDLIDFD